MNRFLIVAIALIAVASFSALGMSIVTANNANQEAIRSIPGVIAYQGYLTDDKGAPVKDGRHTIEFTMYDQATAGRSSWSEEQEITTANGVFSVMLGANKPMTEKLFLNQSELHLGIAIDGGDEVSPRQRLASVPFAIVAHTANTAARATSLDCRGCVTSTHLASGAGGSSSTGTVSTLTSPNGQFQVRVTNDGIFLEGPDDDYTISLLDDEVRVGEGSGQLRIRNGDIDISAPFDIKAQASGGSIGLKAGTRFDAESGTDLRLKSDMDVEIDAGLSIDANAGVDADFTGGGTTTIDGAIVRFHNGTPCKPAAGTGDAVVATGTGSIIGGNSTVLICN